MKPGTEGANDGWRNIPITLAPNSESVQARLENELPGKKAALPGRLLGFVVIVGASPLPAVSSPGAWLAVRV